MGVFDAADGYSDSFTLERAIMDDIMVAYRMNGVPLPLGHGWPARMIVPAHYGMKHVQWLTGIELVSLDYKGHDHWLDNFRCTHSHIIYGDQTLFIRQGLFAQLGGFPNQPVLEDVAFAKKILTRTIPHLLPLTVTTDSRKFIKMGIWRSFFRVLMIILHVECGLPTFSPAFFPHALLSIQSQPAYSEGRTFFKEESNAPKCEEHFKFSL